MIDSGRFLFGSRRNDPLRGFGEIDAHSESVGTFCVDTYEYPNKRGAMPTTGVSWSRARSLCESRGKRLCTEREWERACKGPGGFRFPTGNQHRAGVCNISEEGKGPGSLAKAGSFSDCRSGFGIVDMSGNVAEWTSSQWSPEIPDRVVKGGAAEHTLYSARCSARANEAPKVKNQNMGFRCCAIPE